MKQISKLEHKISIFLSVSASFAFSVWFHKSQVQFWRHKSFVRSSRGSWTMTLVSYEYMHSLNKWKAQFSFLFFFVLIKIKRIAENYILKCEKTFSAQSKKKSFVKQKNAFPGKQISFFLLLFCIFRSGFAKLAQNFLFSSFFLRLRIWSEQF